MLQIDAQGKTRIFYCTGKNITIKNITLKNGFTEEDGGAICNRGELTITDSTLTGNTTKNSGGAIYLENSKKYESENCTFKDNEPDDVYEEKD